MLCSPMFWLDFVVFSLWMLGFVFMVSPHFRFVFFPMRSGVCSSIVFPILFPWIVIVSEWLLGFARLCLFRDFIVPGVFALFRDVHYQECSLRFLSWKSCE